MNVVDVWLAYQGITRTAGTQAYFYNYLAEDMLDKTYDGFIILSEEGRRRKIVHSDDETVDDNNPLFFHINGAPIRGISLHVTPTKKSRKKRDGTETQ